MMAIESDVNCRKRCNKSLFFYNNEMSGIFFSFSLFFDIYVRNKHFNNILIYNASSVQLINYNVAFDRSRTTNMVINTSMQK